MCVCVCEVIEIFVCVVCVCVVGVCMLFHVCKEVIVTFLMTPVTPHPLAPKVT